MSVLPEMQQRTFVPYSHKHHGTMYSVSFASLQDRTFQVGYTSMHVTKHSVIRGELSFDMIKQADEGITEYTHAVFQFVDESRQAWKYSALLHLDNLWPTPDVCVKLVPRPPSTDYCYALMASPNSGERFEVRFEDGPSAWGTWQYGVLAYRVAIDESRLRVHMQVGVIDPRARNNILEVQYFLPYDLLLWQRPMQLRERIKEFMGVPVIALERITRGVPDLPPSPIRVESAT